MVDIMIWIQLYPFHFQDLEAAQCIVVEDETNIRPLTLGRIASYYYLRYTTVKLFNDHMAETSTIQDLLNLLCNASEYEELPVRHNEVSVISLSLSL
jgi:replicative superfamily II helicase